MAPEVFVGKRYTTKADVYSFAMVMCELVVEGGDLGASLFSGINTYEVACNGDVC